MEVIAYFLFLFAALGVASWFWSLLKGHSNYFPKEWVLGCCVLGLLFFMPTLRAEWAALRAGWAMSKLTGREMRFTCVADVDAVLHGLDVTAGYVQFPREQEKVGIAKLRKDTCHALAEFMANPDDLGRESPNYRKIFAVHVVSHEARHVLGERSEPATDCQAIQRNALLAKVLGAHEISARAMALIYYQQYYPRHPYYSADCKQGGAMDENLPTSPWNLLATSGALSR